MLNEEARDYFKQEGKKGGKHTLEKYGRDHYVEIGKLSAQSRRKKLMLKELETGELYPQSEPLT